jgi:DNA-binding transcriptional LysR family regulator
MDRLLSMQVFAAAVESGSFTAAANVFGITPAMVSKHVGTLEKRLGATLLARTTRTQKLTEIGKKYYDSCKQILRQIEEAEAGAEAMTNRPRGHLRVSASVSFGSLELAPLVCDYLLRFPDVNVDLELSDRYVDVIDEGFDVAIRIGELKDSSLVAKKISMFEVAVCASPDYIAKAGMPKKPEHLADHQCLGFTNWHTQGGWKVILAQKAARVPRFESNNGQCLRTAAVRGLGIIMMPKALLRPDIKAGRLIEVLRNHVPPPRPIHALYPKERQRAPKLTSFVGFLAAGLRQRA